ncbi:MAG: hypothetical protein Q8M92_09185 [Candidatus Subteraquimicrobiales bacterium]|nr:hypothetical protein [Candidatus Subteraquimicrobiales bacterium]
MENSFASLVNSANEILILLPSKPFMDQVAGGLSLYLSLAGSGKSVSISCPLPMVTEYSRLIGVDKVGSDLGNKNLVINLVNYDANGVDKVSYDIESGQFKLTITPKTGFKSPTKEQIDINYSGTSGDLVILIGGANDSHFPALLKEEFKSAKLVHLGTRLLEVLNNDLQVLSFAKPASSTSELVASLLKESGLLVNEDIATNLLAGIEEQSKNFQGDTVTADTFLIFSELLKLGGKRTQKIIPAMRYPQGAIPTRPFNQMTPEEAEQELNQDIPPSWSEPKIFTGTSLS